MTIMEAVSLATSVATALATVALFYVTHVLAKETKNLADATERPLVTANIALSSQANGFLNLEIMNAGNAPAFDVQISISPNLTVQGEKFEPFKHVPVINPSSKLAVFLIDSINWGIDREYKFSLSWKKSPSDQKRYSLEYSIDLRMYTNIPFNAMIDPMVKVANEIETWRKEFSSDLMARRRSRLTQVRTTTLVEEASHKNQPESDEGQEVK